MRKLMRAMKAAVVTLACFATILPWQHVGAAQSGRPASPGKSAVGDVRLGADGTLRGKLVDLSARPLADQTVVLYQAGRTVAQTKTDARGEFAFQKLGSGVYSVAVGEAAVTCRFWAAKAAPPAAAEQLVMAANTTVVRGQQPIGNVLSNPLVLGLIIAAAIAIPVAARGDKEKPDGS
jgi:hypothetical protein